MGQNFQWDQRFSLWSGSSLINHKQHQEQEQQLQAADSEFSKEERRPRDNWEDTKWRSHARPVACCVMIDIKKRTKKNRIIHWVIFRIRWRRCLEAYSCTFNAKKKTLFTALKYSLSCTSFKCCLCHIWEGQKCPIMALNAYYWSCKKFSKLHTLHLRYF